MQKPQNLTRNATWLIAGKALAFAAALALPLIIVRRLSPFQVGMYQQVFLVINTLVTVLPLSVSMSAYYFLPREPERGRQVVLNICLYSVGAGVLAWATLTAFPSIVARALADAALTGYAPLIGLAATLLLLGAAMEPISVARQEIKTATAFIVGSSVSRGALMTGAALVFSSVPALVWAIVIFAAAQSAVTLIYIESNYPGFWRAFDWPMARRQLRYAIPLGFSGIIWYCETDLHNYFVSHLAGTVAFAVYSYGTFDVPLVGIVTEGVASVMIPRMSYLQKVGDHRAVVAVVGAAMRKLAGIVFPIAGVLLVVSREFILFLFTKRYEASVPIFRVNLCLLPLAFVVTDPVIRAYTAFHATLVRIRVVMFVLLCAALWVFTSRYGGLGAISVVVAARYFETAVIAVLLWPMIGILRQDMRLLRDPAKLAAAAVAAAAVTEFVRNLLAGSRPYDVLAFCGTVYLFVYVAAVVALRIPNADEWAMARSIALRAGARLRLRSRSVG